MKKLQIPTTAKTSLKNSKIEFLSFIITICLIIASCSQKISSLISTSESFPHEDTITVEEIKNLEFKKSNYCQEETDICICYYYGKPLEDEEIQYSSEFNIRGIESIVNLKLTRDSLEKKHSGTVILIHGFRASKEFMLNSALYFRFLGFEVVVPDLLGHGESSEGKKYGVDDSKFINGLIDNLISKGIITDKNIYLVGNSMGGLTAARISSLREDIRGIILLAPILSFDKAMYNYFKATHPLLSKIIPQKDIYKGASLALEEADIKLDDTHIKPLLTASNTPILIFSSTADLIAPHKDFEDLNRENIKVVALKGRNHPSMSLIGINEHEVLSRWLVEIESR
ncbi:alpha/beta hydrolase [Microbulbifer epialgicus]|uniref:Alpha/beta hydrolase n=1 Tax=Microbulbifer epialgicus TaxID=393907 RepID=A0ABV4P7B4_9GAMM